MLKLRKKCFGIHSASSAIRTACWLLLAFMLGPSLVTGNNINAPDTVGNVGRFTSLALDAKGHPVVSYHDLTNRDLKLLHCNDPYCEGDESGSISTLDTAGWVGTYTSLALDVTGRPVISYCHALDGNLKLLHCENSDCSRSSISVPDSSNIIGKYTSLVLDAAGNPVISYWASKTGLKILHCDDPKCEGDESSNIAIPDTGEVGWYSSLALDAAGNPVVGYYNFSSGDLKILHCDDPNCAGDESKNITAPDTTGSVGSDIYMVLDDKGNPVVIYYDSSKGQLKILHCDDPNCAGDETGNIATPTDLVGNVGLYSSLVLDAAGNPVVSYYDFSNGNLNILHCANQTCNSKKR